jgi:hypothetical protein
MFEFNEFGTRILRINLVGALKKLVFSANAKIKPEIK